MRRGVVAEQRGFELSQPRGQQLHRGIGLDQTEGGGGFFDDIDDQSRLRCLFQNVKLASDRFLRFALDAMQEVDEVAEVVRVDVGSLQLAFEFVERGVASDHAIRFDETEEGAPLLRTLFAAKVAKKRLEMKRRKEFERDLHGR